MRPGQQNKRGRGRGNNNNNNGGGGNNNNNNFNRKGGNPLTRTYDSSGPDVKIRGTAQHIAEKYAQLARDAQSSGDRVIAENYLQHAEHYNRIIASAQAQMQERFQRDDRGDYNDRDGADRDGDDMDSNDNDGDDVVIVQPPQSRQHQPRPQPESQPQPTPAPAPVVSQAEVIDGTGPQPEIEGIPAEVAMDEEGSGGQPRERQPRRRSTGNRPRRPRRGAEGEAAAEGEGASAEAPVLADVASE
ncbi:MULTISPECIES: DUF4167 domain-containing protein [Rhizobium]|jgi:hypothetical protein|uniref:DUF4167 domain-containing protein n=1 Tax=Rhizobium anhuiense TaxID=1184720 RepID=A0A432N7X2_9HYPH|nr:MULTISPECIES: DUF4167 domain-containing protein [Rhizobium]KZS50133.1 hypothetical protein AS890_04295 [Rhizobium anhuiense bv. trifolii]MBB3303189.1 hypothetical protein [Rhizobium sp. BK112]MBB3372231.1 hypothetical protein [Rhizobium sp. BK077]MBB3747465.1 hypothetical protein [Rhizobium sp. BK591]MBB4183000.1 hypothetical protein [Rhizobium sp. BK109]